MMNILITYTTLPVSKGMELQQRGDRYRKNVQKAKRLQGL